MAMEIVTSLDTLPDAAKGAVLVTGNFDGVHRGHRRLIAAARALAAERGLPVCVLTFEPHPRSLFRPDEPPFRITPFPIKARLLDECGVDFLFSLSFDRAFAEQSAEDFIARVLTGAIAPAAIVAGEDFRFGAGRAGTPETLRRAGYNVHIIEKLTQDGGENCSSSAVRAALRAGDMARAGALLGHEWEIEGTVVEGDRRGRELGYPTANVRLHETIHPAYGVYACRVLVAGEDLWRPAATNIGIRPMFALPTGQVEAHILDFDGDLYGSVLRVRPVLRLRGEEKFGTLEALIRQIGEDCRAARDTLENAA